MKDEALKLALGKIKAARDCRFEEIDTLLFEAEELLEQARAAPVQEPVAWRYDLAKYRENDLRGRQWAHSVFSPTKPYIDEMVRNLTPLYTTPPTQPAPVQEPVAFKIYKPTSPRGAIPNVQDAELPWVYDQDPSSGNVASMWVTPVKATPPAAQRQWVGLTDEERMEIYNKPLTIASCIGAVEDKLKEKNT